MKQGKRSIGFAGMAIGLFLSAALLGPVLVSALDVFLFATLAVVLFLYCLYAFSPWNQSALPKRISLAVVSTCLSLTAFDLAARIYVYYVVDDRPKELIMHPWPPLPQVNRFEAGVRFEGDIYGDLAAVSRRKEWRDYNKTFFITDQFGFRNELPQGAPSPPPDLILLGDSFGLAMRTPQEKTLGGLLSGTYGWRVYNLSVGAASPWQEYVNLLTEGDRLRANDGTIVLWLLFAGNDLDDEYLPYYEAARLPWRGRLGRLTDPLKKFRQHSPLYHLLKGRKAPGPESVIEKHFIDGRRVLFFAPYARNKGRSADEVRRHYNFNMLKATVEAMRRLADEKRLTVAVALAPSKEEVYSWVLDGAPPWSAGGSSSALSEALKEMAVQNGMPFLDLTPTLVGASRRVYDESGELLWWNDDTHWNPLGQKIAAAAIQQELLLPLRRSLAGVTAHGAPNTK